MSSTFPASSAPVFTGWGSPFTAWPPDNASAFPLFDSCPSWCAGHVDDSTSDTHHTHWERFGPDGVVVEQTEGRPASVSLTDVDRRAQRTEEQVALLEFQITMAQRFAARLNGR